MKKYVIIIFLLAFVSATQAQIVTNNLRSMLEVPGHAAFGGENGISVFDHTIGFNVYAITTARHMGAGYAGFARFLPIQRSFEFTIFPSNTADAQIGIGVTGLRLGSPTGAKIQTFQELANCALDVGRGTSVNGTVVLHGSSFSSYFNYGTDEHTYIRGGKPGSKVILNDYTQISRTQIGSTSTIVGVNYNNPVYTFEVRQAGGTGLKLGVEESLSWEWRVAGSPASFYLRYANAIKGHFNPSTGVYTAVSDDRLKKDIEELPGLLDKLDQLRPVDYAIKENNPNHVRSIGFIAQDVHALFPQLVNVPAGDSKYHSIVYGGFAPIAIRAVQQEQILIENEIKAHKEAEVLVEKIEKALNKKLNTSKN